MEMPPVPEKPFVAGTVTNKSLSIAWKVQGNVSQITNYTVCSRRIDENTSDATPWEIVTTKNAEQEYRFDNLKSNTAYQFRVASNSKQTQSFQSEMSDVIKTAKDFQTPSRSPTPQKPTIDGKPTHNSVPLAWGMTGDTSNVTNYTISYKAVDIDADLGVAGQKWMNHDTRDGKQTCVVENLDPETSYRFYVSSNSDKGKSPPSPISAIIWTTEDPQRVPTPQRLRRGGRVTHNSVNLTWEVDGNAKHITHYTVTCSKANGKGPTMVFKTEGAQTNYTVEELLPNMSYRLHVTAITKNSQSKESETITISTAAKPDEDTKKDVKPPTPDSLSVEGPLFHNSVCLAWTVSGNTNNITHYTISFRKATKNKGAPWTFVKTSGTETYYTISDLEPQSKYQFRVASHTRSQQSQLSKILEAYTAQRPRNMSCDELPIPRIQKPSLTGDVTHNSVALTWTVHGNATQVANYTVSYQRANGTGPLMTYNTESTRTSYKVEELLPGTAYIFHVTLKTQKGQSSISEVSDTVTTNIGPISRPAVEQMLPLPQKPTLAGNITHTSVPLTWEVAGDLTQIINYTLFYKKVSSTGPQMSVETSGVENFYTVEELDPETSYYFWVTINIAPGGQSRSPPSRISDTFTTLQDPNRQIPEHTIPLLQKPTLAGEPSHNHLPLTWRVIGDTSFVTTYTLTYRKVISNAPWVIFETCSTKTHCNVDNLDPNTSYQFRVAANTDKAQSLPSEKSDVIVTAEDPKCRGLLDHLPPTPTNLTAISKASHDSVPLAWEIKGNASYVTHYTVSYTVVGEKANGRWTSIETDSAVNYFTVEGLDPETTYRFRVASNTDQGQSLPTETSTALKTAQQPFTTRDKADELPMLLTPNRPKVAGKPSHDSVTLAWKVPGNTAPITQYTVNYRKTDGPKDTWVTVETHDKDKHFTVADLEPDTPYQFRVISNSDKGQSLPSEISDTISTVCPPKCPIDQKPPTPGKLTCIGPPSCDSLTLTWTVDGDTSNVTHYTLTYRAVDKDMESSCNSLAMVPWSLFNTTEQWFMVHNLEAETSYEFSIAANTSDGQTYKGDSSEIFTTADMPEVARQNIRLFQSVSAAGIPITCPSKPRLAPDQRPTQHSLPIVWEMETDIQVTHFILYYKAIQEENWKETEISGLRNEYTITGLHPRTSYNVRVKAFTSTDSSDFSEEAGPFQTDNRSEGQIYREQLYFKSKIVSSDKDMAIYQVPLQLTDRHEAERTQRFEFGTKPTNLQQEKVILVVGQTGAGKSTLINGLLNYIIGVEWVDKFRFRLVEESALFEEQHESQTRVITVYTLHHHNVFKVPYTVTIIDTPGFGDTAGIDKDKLITESITHLFSKEEYGIDHIDAIGFVAQSSLSRLTPNQKYIFDSILSLFGKDIGENIFLLITFSDSQKPPVLASIKEAQIPYKAKYKFNNSALFARNDAEDDEFDLMFWKMGALSFKKFLDELICIEGKSLYLTKEVLEERQQLEVYVTGIQQDIHNGLNKLEQYRLEVNVVRQHEADIEKNKDFKYTVEEITMVQVDLETGKHVTNCMTCNRTCHYPCAYANDEDKKHCSAMNRKGSCTVCPNKCVWNMHRNVPYKIEGLTKAVVKTSDDLKKRYEKAMGGKMNAEKLTEEILVDFYNLQINVLYLASEIRRGLERLSEIALRPNPLSTVEYLDILIKSERAEAKPGFQARIDQLERLKAQAETLNEMSDENYDPFKQYRETLKLAPSSQARNDALDDFKKKNPSFAKKFWKRVTDFILQ